MDKEKEWALTLLTHYLHTESFIGRLEQVGLTVDSDNHPIQISTISYYMGFAELSDAQTELLVDYSMEAAEAEGYDDFIILAQRLYNDLNQLKKRQFYA